MIALSINKQVLEGTPCRIILTTFVFLLTQLIACGRYEIILLEASDDIDRIEVRRSDDSFEGFIYMVPGAMYSERVNLSIFGVLRPELSVAEVDRIQEVGLHSETDANGKPRYKLVTEGGVAVFECITHYSIEVSHTWSLLAYPRDVNPDAWLPNNVLSFLKKNPNGSFSWMNRDGTRGIEVFVKGGVVKRLEWNFDQRGSGPRKGKPPC